MGDTNRELEPIAKDATPKKYVAVVYHHVSNQTSGGTGCSNGEDTISPSASEGTCKLVSRKQKSVVEVPDYFILSLISIAIFVPVGLAAFVNSMKVRKAIQQENSRIATDASNWALQHALTAIFAGPIIACLVFICVFLPLYQG